MRYLYTLLALLTLSAPAIAGDWKYAKSVAQDLIEAIETDKAVKDLGLAPALNTAQADFLDGFQNCRVSKTFEKYGKKNFKKDSEILLWYHCPEPIRASDTIVSKSWHISLIFEKGKLASVKIYDVELKPAGWEPEK